MRIGIQEHKKRRKLVNLLLKAQSRHEMSDVELGKLIGTCSSTISHWRIDKKSVPTGARVDNIRVAIKLLNENGSKTVSQIMPDRQATSASEIKPVPKIVPSRFRFCPHCGEKLMA